MNETISETKEEEIIWFAGLFEGEGTFSTFRGRAKALVLTSTDLDVINRVVKFFGGSVYEITKRKEHWKDSWLWSLRGYEAYELALKIYPWLLSRRKSQAELWIKYYEKVIRNKKRYNEYISSIFELLEEGWTHERIAKKLGKERSAITKAIIRNKGSHKIKEGGNPKKSMLV